jgi:hypothetical protein
MRDESSDLVWNPEDLEKIPGPTHLDPDPDFEIPGAVYEAKAEANTRNSTEHLFDAYHQFLEEYRRWGGYRYHGFTAQEDPENFRGPAILSEADIVLRLAPLLASRFPETSEVHAEFNIANSTRADYDKQEDRTQRIDLVASDLSTMKPGPSAQEEFRNLVHWLFVEVKWVPKGWWGGPWEGLEGKRRVESVSKDAWRLQRHLELGRCLVAAVFVVDDECLFDYLHGLFDWPRDVPVLVASPSSLAQAGYEDDPVVTAAIKKAEELAERGEYDLPDMWPHHEL